MEAFPDKEPEILIRDNDAIFGKDFRKQVEAMGIRDMPVGVRPPWMNCYAERVIGSIRRECTDHVVPFNERHLVATLREYVSYYNTDRAHLSLERNAPNLRTRARTPAVEIHGTPVLGGLHHRYRAVA